MKPAILVLYASLACAQPAMDSLPRRGYFGVGLEQKDGAVGVTSIAPGSTAATVGIQVGDELVAIDGNSTSTTAAVVTSIGQHGGGEAISVTVRRNGELRTMEATLNPFPMEQMENAKVYYESVEPKPGVKLRTIVSVPTSPRAPLYPAVLLIQGGGCGSVDAPIGPPIGQPGLMHTIGSRGFVTMRVEKSGVGDSQGEPCDAIGFTEEFAGYRAAYRALRSHPSVDPNRIYLVGLSLGGLFAPLLAAENPVAGITVYGTLAAPPPAYPGRSERFFQEFAKVDIPAAWAKVNTRVQVLHGEYDVDPVINRSVHESIAAMVNKAHPGSASFQELEGLDHGWTRQPSLEASIEKRGQGEQTPLFGDTILKFLTAGNTSGPTQ